jgi:DNA-3-methyladenine glycosylase I
MRTRCPWPGEDALYQRYHDEEWGVPVHDDRTHFEFLVLEGAQAGLSWLTVLRKRERYREVLERFDPARVATFDEGRVAELLSDPGIIRNRQKVAAAISNARAFLAVEREFGSFDAFLWRFVGGKTLRNSWTTLAEIPAKTPEAEAMSRELVKRGFRFVGPTICYSHMQACGLVNDHLVSCFRYREV